jgi:DNA repair protein RadC
MNDMYSFKSVLADTLSVRESKAIETALNLFQSPQELLAASEQELMQIHGIGPKKAKQVIAAIKLAKLLNNPKGKPVIIRSPQDVFELLHAELAYLPKEHFVSTNGL